MASRLVHRVRDCRAAEPRRSGYGHRRWPVGIAVEIVEPEEEPHRIGDLADLPANPHFLDHSATLMDPARQLEWVAILNTEKHLVYGYVFRREDYPWMQHWGNYASATELVRGMEFGTQPYDVPRREAISMGSLFGTPAFRWLPAKSKIGTRYLMFYTRVPEGFTQVDDVQQQGGELIITDSKSRQTVRLAASLPL